MGLPGPAQARNPCFSKYFYGEYLKKQMSKTLHIFTQALYYGDEDMPFTEKFGTKYQKL